jgi:hypothetical protein
MVEEISGELALERCSRGRGESGLQAARAQHDGAIGAVRARAHIIRTAASHAIPRRNCTPSFLEVTSTGPRPELGTPLRCRYAGLAASQQVTAAKEMNMIGMPIVRHGELIGVSGIGVRGRRRRSATPSSPCSSTSCPSRGRCDRQRAPHSDEQRRAACFPHARVAGLIASESGA